MHVAQINFLPVPAGLAPADVFEQWPTLADVAEAVASAGTRVSVIQLATRPERVRRNGIDYRVIPPKDPIRQTVSYSDNFRFNRIQPWTH